MGRWPLANVIPFRLQGREGLSFLASVNLGLDTRMISTLSVADGTLMRCHRWLQIRKKLFLDYHRMNSRVNMSKALIFLTLQDYLLWLLTAPLAYYMT
jgi:hypothetical protein